MINSVPPTRSVSLPPTSLLHSQRREKLKKKTQTLHSHRRENPKSYIRLTVGSVAETNVSPVRYRLGFYTPEDGILHSHRRENLKSKIHMAVVLPFSSS
jgi:hypothetical protein